MVNQSEYEVHELTLHITNEQFAELKKKIRVKPRTQSGTHYTCEVLQFNIGTMRFTVFSQGTELFNF